MESIQDIRIEAIRQPAERFCELHPGLVLVLREELEGDLQFASSDDLWAEPRAGNTLLHIPRVGARERVRKARAKGRRPMKMEQWFAVQPNAGNEQIVGRDRDCDVVISDFTVSAKHVRLRFVAGGAGCWVQDAGSRNGTTHNGLVLHGPESRELLSGDELAIGKYIFLCLNCADFHAYLTGKL